MKARIIGSVLVIVVLIALALVTGGFDTGNNQPVSAPVSNPTDNAFKDLKIN